MLRRRRAVLGAALLLPLAACGVFPPADLLGQPFASGTLIDRAVTLPRLGSRTVPVEFTVPTARLLNLLRRVRIGDLSSLGYRLRGSATWGYTGIPLDFDRQGDLEVLRRFSDLLRPLLAPG